MLVRSSSKLVDVDFNHRQKNIFRSSPELSTGLATPDGAYDLLKCFRARVRSRQEGELARVFSERRGGHARCECVSCLSDVMRASTCCRQNLISLTRIRGVILGDWNDSRSN